MSMESSTTSAASDIASPGKDRPPRADTNKALWPPTRERLTPRLLRSRKRGEWSGLVAQLGVFDVHVLEFAGFEYLAAFHALDEFRILFAGDDLHTRMLACHVGSLLGDLRELGWSHKSGTVSPAEWGQNYPKFSVF